MSRQDDTEQLRGAGKCQRSPSGGQDSSPRSPIQAAHLYFTTHTLFYAYNDKCIHTNTTTKNTPTHTYLHSHTHKHTNLLLTTHKKQAHSVHFVFAHNKKNTQMLLAKLLGVCTISELIAWGIYVAAHYTLLIYNHWTCQPLVSSSLLRITTLFSPDLRFTRAGSIFTWAGLTYVGD